MAIPFVPPSELPLAVEQIQTLFHDTDLLKPWEITFSQTDIFHHKDSATVYLKPDESSIQRLQGIREALNTIFKIPANRGDETFRPHLTIGQTDPNLSVSELQQKAEMLLPISWSVESLVVIQKNETDAGRMVIFASIPQGNMPPASAQSCAPCCYSFDGNNRQYTVYRSSASLFDEVGPPTEMTLSTYNILHSPHQPQVESSPRLPLLLNAIFRQSSTFLILQEVTDVSWHYFLSDPILREKYPYVSAPAHLPLPNHRNIVLLSTIPFKAHYFPLFTPHKPALIVDIDGLVVAGVHLHAGLHEEKLALKLKELAKLTTCLDSTGKPVIIAGDFNIPNIPREYTAALPKIHDLLGRYVDAWVEKPSGDGDTFTPDTNRFAKEGAKVLYPQRHDRVYFSRGVGIRVEKTSLFGFPEKEDELASDHWGFSVDLRIDLEEHSTNEVTQVTAAASLEVPETNWTDKLVLQTLTNANEIPDADHDRKLKSVWALMNAILTPMKQHFPFKLQVVGSFALGVHTTSSDIDVLAVSTISQQTFWEVFLQHIQRFKLSDPTNRVKVLRIIKGAKQPLVELLVDTCRVEVLYCSAGKLINTYPLSSYGANDSWNQVPSLPADSDLFLLPAPTLYTLNSYRDDHAILSSVSNLKAFRLARRAFKYFCSRRGIYSSKLGFFGGFAVTLLIAPICHILPATSSASEILAAAISRYSVFPWEDEELFFPGVEQGNPKREGREAMYISSISRPSHNVMKNASQSTLQTIKKELRIAADKLSTATFEELCSDGLTEFFTDYKAFIKVQCAFWGTYSAEGRKWITWIESRLVILLVNLSKEFPTLETRLWPARFADITSDDVQGTYLVGISGSGIDEGAFNTVLRDVERIMKGEDQDVVDRWISVTLAKGKQILAEGLEIDTRTWDWEEDIILDDNASEDEDETTAPAIANLTVSEKLGKLRPSHEVYNRLVWDQRYSPEEYLVGYEDRFKGVREMPLTSWKRELSDEEFIPFHRVVYFREKGVDGKIVWDRRTRVDLIFGSG
jgi:uncharacterized protein (UPF0248 family)/endonuclease/exonuclease/phosphatase family metal-dependent hydrolase